MNKIKFLKDKAKTIRRHVINMIHNAGSGHVGGSLSCVDILVVLYFRIMECRDVFVLSKGHAAPALYAVLAETGHFPLSDLATLRKNDGYLQGHPDVDISGVVVSSGSLGQGISIANGMMLGYKLDKVDRKVFVLLGDGECDEGQVWEAAMLAGHYKLDVTVIVDRNGFQIDGETEKVMGLEPIGKKWEAFGWNVIETDGNDVERLILAFDSVKEGVPNVIIAYTSKGKGVSFMEGNNKFHAGTVGNVERDRALVEL